MVNPYVLYRNDFVHTAEFTAVESLLPGKCGENVARVPAGSVVFPRFRTLPYGDLLEEEIIRNGSFLVNSWEQYQYVSDLYSWVEDLGEMTPAVYKAADVSLLPEGEYFLKGETNSVKHDWLGSAYAPNLDAVNRIISKIKNHNVVGGQKLVIRPFIHYRQLATMPSGQPVFNEWRVFVLKGEIVGKGFYWNTKREMFSSSSIFPLNASKFQKTVHDAVDAIKGKIDFVVIDVAEKPDGSWQVIELNDGNMSGLCGVDPHMLWSRIKLLY